MSQVEIVVLSTGALMGLILVARWARASRLGAFDAGLEARFVAVAIATFGAVGLVFGAGGAVALLAPPLIVGAFGLYFLATPDGPLVWEITNRRLGVVLLVAGVSGTILGFVRAFAGA